MLLRKYSALQRLLLVILWVSLNVADAFWQYNYVQSVVNTNPRAVANRNSYAFRGYEAMMFIYGFALGVVNYPVTGMAFHYLTSGGSKRDPRKRILLSAFGWLVIFPIFVIMTITPFLGGFLVKAFVEEYYWKHRCDSYPMYAILDGRAYNDPANVQDLVRFYNTRTNRFLYTYELTNPGHGDEWSFQLRDWAVDQASIAQAEYPTLQSITYDFSNLTLTGNCTLPSGNGVTTRDCVEGAFDPGTHLAFDLTSYVPFNTTSPSLPPLSLLNATIILKIEDSAWMYPDASPTFVLRAVNATTGHLDQVVLRTAIQNPRDCTQLKVCLAGVQVTEGATGLVGAEVMVPMGIALFGEAQHADQCTRHHK